MKPLTDATPKVTKRSIADTTTFAINYIPSVDVPTLEKFLELVNVNGTHGSISTRQFAEKMQLLIKHVPNVDIPSLVTLAELLNLTTKPGDPAKDVMLAEPHFSPPTDSYQAILN